MSDDEAPLDGTVVPDEPAEPDQPARSPDPPEADVVSPGRELERREPEQSRGVLFKTEDPVEILAQASGVANAFKDVLRSQGMIQSIQGREHVKIEGWQTVGVMLGVSVVPVWTRRVCDPVTGEPERTTYEVVEFNRRTQVERRFTVDGYDWEARVEVRRADGAIIAAGEGMVSRNESTWSKRDDFSLRSMAQTRASSKALRAVLGWIVTMAGYSGTPSEELASEPEGAAQAASPELEATLNGALTWLLHDPARVHAVRAQIQEAAGGFLPAPAAQGAVLAIKAFKDAQAEADASADTNDEKPKEPESGE